MIPIDPTELGALTAWAEGAEAEFMYQYEAGTPDAARADLGIATARIGGGVALSMRADPTRYWSKALGFGFDEPVTAALIDEVVDFYRDNGDQGATIQIAPSVLPADWEQIQAAHHLRPGGQIVRLAAPIEAVRPGRSALKIAPVTQADAAEWASVILAGFGMPEAGLLQMLAASVTNPAFHPFAAWDGDRIIAGANLLVHGLIGSLNAAATSAADRGRGAQSALIAARTEAAVRAGCRWLVVETGKPAPGDQNVSLNNLRRAGLEVLYVRQNWIWEAGADPAPTFLPLS